MPTMITLLVKAAAKAAYIHVPQTTCSISGSGAARFHLYREALTARSFCNTTSRMPELETSVRLLARAQTCACQQPNRQNGWDLPERVKKADTLALQVPAMGHAPHRI